MSKSLSLSSARVRGFCRGVHRAAARVAACRPLRQGRPSKTHVFLQACAHPALVVEFVAAPLGGRHHKGSAWVEHACVRLRVQHGGREERHEQQGAAAAEPAPPPHAHATSHRSTVGGLPLSSKVLYPPPCTLYNGPCTTASLPNPARTEKKKTGKHSAHAEGSVGGLTGSQRLDQHLLRTGQARNRSRLRRRERRMGYPILWGT